MRLHLLTGLLLLATGALLQSSTGQFEAEIRAFEASDLTNPPPKNAVLFLGSSSIRLWKSLASDFPDYTVINRGFGGSQIEDSIRYAERIVLPYEPRVIVFYAGGNDINAGKTPERVLYDFKTLAEMVHKNLPKTQLHFIAIAPNPARWPQVDRVRKANQLIEEFTRSDARLGFIDVFPHMLGTDGQPRPEIFSPDRLHMNDEGYALWRQLVGEHLTGAPASCRPVEHQH
jgi:lysophospholipase L1-like esterase